MAFAFEKYCLYNGLTLIVQENRHAKSVVVRGYLRGGSISEPPQQTGLASFTASVMGRATEKRTFAEIAETLDSLAASAYVKCGRHLFNFGGKSLAQDFDLLFEIITDSLVYPSFPAKEVENVRGLITAGLKRMQDDPPSLAELYFREMLYTSDHAYGRPVIGTPESVSQLRRNDLTNLYDNAFHPNGGAVAVVGDVDSKKVYKSVEATLGQWRPGFCPPKVHVPKPRPLTEKKCRVHAMANKPQASLLLGGIGPSRQAKDFHAAYVGDVILGQLGLGGRIGMRVRSAEGLAYHARSRLRGGLGPGPWLVHAGVNSSAIDRAVELILAEIRCLRQQPVTDQELADAKAYLTGVLPLERESNEGTAAALLDMQVYERGDDYFIRYADIINAVTKEEVQAAVHKYLSDELYVLMIAGGSHET